MTAEEPEDIDQFLYGDEAAFLQQMAVEEPQATVDEPIAQEPVPTEENIENESSNGKVAADVSEGEDEDEEDDDFEIVLGAGGVSSEPAKRGLTQVSMSSSAADNSKASASNVNATSKPAINLNEPAMLNGEQIYNVELDSLPEKPWRLPGADVTDYFNYGFTEPTWREYCAKQRGVREEFGTQKRIAVFDGSNASGNLPFIPGMPPGLPAGMPPFPFPPGHGAAGGAHPFPFPPPPPFMFPPPPAGTSTIKEKEREISSKDSNSKESSSRDRDRDRDSARRSSRRRSRSRSRSRSRDRDSKRRR